MRQNRDQADACRHGVAQDSVRPRRAHAAQKFHSRAATKAFGRGNNHGADCACSSDVRSAAGRDVETAHLNQSKRAGAGWLFPKRQRRGLLGIA